jgi:NTE family protein
VAETGLRRLLAQELSGRRLEDGRPGAYVVATEMGSGRARVIAARDATEALLASAAFPEVFPPVGAASGPRDGTYVPPPWL